MKIAIIASYCDESKQQIRKMAAELTKMGHEVTSDWFLSDVPDMALTWRDRNKQVCHNHAAIRNAQVVILDTTYPSTNNAMWLEYGYALSCSRLKIYTVGANIPRMYIHFHCPMYMAWPDLLTYFEDRAREDIQNA